MALLGRGPNDIVRDVLKNTFPKEGLERLFDTTILARVEGENSNPPTGVEAGWQGAQEGVQRTELFIDGDSHGLKNTADRLLHEFVGSILQRTSNGIGQVCRGLKVFPREGRGKRGSIRFIGIFNQCLLERSWGCF